MATPREIDRQAQLWSLGIGLAGAGLLLLAAAAGAAKRSRAARHGGTPAGDAGDRSRSGG